MPPLAYPLSVKLSIIGKVSVERVSVGTGAARQVLAGSGRSPA